MVDSGIGMASAVSPRGWVLFDDSCGFCSSWVRYWARTLHTHGFEIAPLQEDWVRTRLGSPADEDLLLDLRLLLDDGRQIRGADAYRYVMRRIWWTHPLYLVSIVPPLRYLFDWAYRTFADNRYHFSRTCPLPPRQSGRPVVESEE
jgi:predicted DCC family thiol-disulfide oxidoreductase YuxK